MRCSQLSPSSKELFCAEMPQPAKVLLVSGSFEMLGLKEGYGSKAVSTCIKFTAAGSSPEVHGTHSHILPSPFPSPSPGTLRVQGKPSTPCLHQNVAFLLCATQEEQDFCSLFGCCTRGMYRSICALSSSVELAWPGWAEQTVSCLHRNEIGRRYFSTALDYARTHKIIKTSQLCQTREAWHS